MKSIDYGCMKPIYEVARVINSSLDPAIVLGKIAEHVTLAMEAKGCVIRLLDRQGKTLRASASYGLSQGYLRKGAIEVDKSGLDKEAMAGLNVYIKDVATDPRFQYPESAKEEGIVSAMVVPLKATGDKVIGVLRVYTGTQRDFEHAEVEFLTAIANLSAIAIENARMHQALKRNYEILNDYHSTVYDL